MKTIATIIGFLLIAGLNQAEANKTGSKTRAPAYADLTFDQCAESMLETGDELEGCSKKSASVSADISEAAKKSLADIDENDSAMLEKSLNTFSETTAKHQYLKSSKRMGLGRFFKNWKSARKGYRKWASANPGRAKSFLAKVTSLRKKLRNDTDFRNRINAGITECNASTSNFKCTGDLVESMLRAEMGDSVTSYFQIIPSAHADPLIYGRCGFGGTDPSSMEYKFHALLFGGYRCYPTAWINNTNPYWIEAMTLGPGLELTPKYVEIFLCTGVGPGTSVGPYAEVAVGVGLGMGILFGSRGVCLDVTMNALGLGAFAGVKVVEFGAP